VQIIAIWKISNLVSYVHQQKPNLSKLETSRCTNRNVFGEDPLNRKEFGITHLKEVEIMAIWKIRVLISYVNQLGTNLSKLETSGCTNSRIFGEDTLNTTKFGITRLKEVQIMAIWTLSMFITYVHQ
jgi:hypothetical protein